MIPNQAAAAPKLLCLGSKTKLLLNNDDRPKWQLFVHQAHLPRLDRLRKIQTTSCICGESNPRPVPNGYPNLTRIFFDT